MKVDGVVVLTGSYVHSALFQSVSFLSFVLLNKGEKNKNARKSNFLPNSLLVVLEEKKKTRMFLFCSYKGLDNPTELLAKAI